MNQLTNDEKFSPRVQGGKLLPNLRTLIDGSFYVHENKDVKDVYSYFGGALTKLNLTKYDTIELDTIIANNLYAKTFTLRQTSFQNGDLMVGNAGGIVEAVKGQEITFKDQSGFNVCAFAVGDLIEAYSVRADNSLEITHPQGTVTQVVGNKVTITYYGTSPAFQKGDEVYSVGNTTDSTRKDSLYLSTNRPNTPYLAIYDNINSFDTVGSPTTAWGSATPKVLIGNGKSLNAAYSYGVYIGAGGEFRISPSATVDGVVTHTPVYTSGASLPSSPQATDWHFWTGTQQTIGGVVFYPNTWYKYSGTAWVNQGLLGTYIDGNGIYTGTVVAAQVIAGTLTGFTIQTKADPGIGDRSRVVLSANSNTITFYDEENRAFTIGAYGNIIQFSGGVFALAFQAANVYGTNLTTNYGITFDEYPNPATIAKDVNKNIILSGGALNAGIIASQSWVSSQGYLTSYTETDPTIYAWAKAAAKPTYTYTEVGAAAAAHSHAALDITSGTFADIYIASAATWNGKENVLSFSAPLSRSINAISIPAASSTVNGYLTSTDWNTFNAKVSFPGFGTTGTTAAVGNDARLSDARVASDVYAWAKAATKPSYTAAEVGAVPSSLYGISPIIYDNVANSIGLSSSSQTYWNGKEDVLSFSAPLSRSINAISIPAASSTVNGYLTSTDWNTFNGKATVTSGTPAAVLYYVAATSGGATTTQLQAIPVTINGRAYSVFGWEN